MKTISLVILLLEIMLCSQPTCRAQELDKELSGLAAKLATQIKDNGKKKVTVLDFTDLQGGSSELGRYIAEELTVNLVMTKRDFSVLDRANLKRILAEHKLTATGLVDPDNAKKLGQFAGVDALILGTMTPKGTNISLTAKLITTDTAEIVGAAKAEFKTDETVLQLSSRASTPNDSMNGGSSTPAEKPFGDLQVRVESLKFITSSPRYALTRLTLIITNTSATQTHGVALEPDFYKKFNLSNSHGDEFKTTEVAGIETAFEGYDGRFQGSFTDILPKSSITLVAKGQFLLSGKAEDARPYRLQTMAIWGVKENGRYPNLKKHNLVMDIK